MTDARLSYQSRRGPCLGEFNQARALSDSVASNWMRTREKCAGMDVRSGSRSPLTPSSYHSSIRNRIRNRRNPYSHSQSKAHEFLPSGFLWELSGYCDTRNPALPLPKYSLGLPKKSQFRRPIATIIAFPASTSPRGEGRRKSKIPPMRTNALRKRGLQTRICNFDVSAAHGFDVCGHLAFLGIHVTPRQVCGQMAGVPCFATTANLG
jgi:hypothetical protein